MSLSAQRNRQKRMFAVGAMRKPPVGPLQISGFVQALITGGLFRNCRWQLGAWWKMMRSLKTRLKPAGIVIASVAGAVALAYGFVQHMNARDHLKNPARIAFILNLLELPSSVRDTKCSARAITDLIVTCAFKVDPTDFELLLRGWDFKTQKISGNGRKSGMDAPVGQDFKAVTRHFVHPISFKRVGLVNLVTNQERSLVVANRFEE